VARIACLHTAPSNIAVFDAAAARLGLRLAHAVRADLLAEAEALGAVPASLCGRTRAALDRLAETADRVLLTCSTLGPCATPPHLRADAALARDATRQGGRVAVLCAVETTLAPSGDLFRAAAHDTGAVIALHLVPHAWRAFRAGETGRYHSLIRDAALAALADGADVVALAQASMAGALALLPDGAPVLASPGAGLRAALQSLNPLGDAA
jgi:hypothetical protein